LAGDAFTVADITAFAGMAFAGFAKIDVADDLVHLKDWHARVSARPSIAA
ncbi:MAG: glutathione binding-like protein, partial [Pseudomonadota bacterium]